MTNEQIELVRTSFTRVAPTAVGMFYGRWFEMDPALRPLFKVWAIADPVGGDGWSSGQVERSGVFCPICGSSFG